MAFSDAISVGRLWHARRRRGFVRLIRAQLISLADEKRNASSLADSLCYLIFLMVNIATPCKYLLHTQLRDVAIPAEMF